MRESAGLVFGRKLAETAARRCQRAAAALWVDARTREELIAPTCLFAMEYLRYLAEDSESWDETKEHESQTTREEELIRETSSDHRALGRDRAETGLAESAIVTPR